MALNIYNPEKYSESVTTPARAATSALPGGDTALKTYDAGKQLLGLLSGTKPPAGSGTGTSSGGTSGGYSDPAYSSAPPAPQEPTAPTTQPTGITPPATDTTTDTTRYSRYSSSDDTAVKARSTEDIQKDMMKGAQGEINALNSYYKSLLADQKVVNDKNDRSTASVSTLTGLAGSDEANTKQRETTAIGEQANTRIKNEAAMKVQGIMSKVRESAIAEARSQREEARLDEATRIKNRAARQEEAVGQLQNIAASGVTFEGLKNGDPESFEYLAKQFGSEAALKGAYVLNTPQDQIIDKKLENGKYIIAKMNPLTGKTSVETIDLGLPPSYTKTIDAGNRILAIPDGWDGDPSKLISIGKGLTPSQQASGGSSGGGSGYGGSGGGDSSSAVLDSLSPAAQNIVGLINKGSDINDLIKGTSREAQALRNEVYRGLAAQGGRPDSVVTLFKEGKEVVDDMLTTRADKAIGGWSTRLGGQWGTAYGDAMAKSQQLSAILARDNLGLLKGAMSDKDLAFITSMSTGFEGSGIQSEAYIKERLEAIQTKLANKIAESGGGNGSSDSSSNIKVAPDGTEVEIID